MQRTNSVRSVLTNLAKVAERTGCAVVLIGHMNKSNRTKGIQMLRIIWRVCEWNENDTYRIAGTHYPEYNLVEFNLNQARIVQFGEIE